MLVSYSWPIASTRENVRFVMVTRNRARVFVFDFNLHFEINLMFISFDVQQKNCINLVKTSCAGLGYFKFFKHRNKNLAMNFWVVDSHLIQWYTFNYSYLSQKANGKVTSRSLCNTIYKHQSPLFFFIVKNSV